MRSIVSSLALAALFGCTGASDDTGGGGNGGGNGGGGAGSCGEYNGDVGQVLRYAFTNMSGTDSGGYDVEFTSFDTASGAAVFTSLGYSTTSGTTATSTTVQQLQCLADGVYVNSFTTEYEVNAGGQVFTGSSETTYDPPYLVLPAGIQSGDTWTMTSTATSVDSTAGTTTFDVNQTATASGPESVTVTAGTYDALKITYVMPASDDSHSWLAVGVGAVKTDSSELTSAE